MPTVLVVEDEPMLRASMVRGLSKLTGVSVLAAGSVDEARAIIRETVPQLVITDLNLPDHSGLEVIAELERIRARVPIVVASAYLRRFNVPRRPGIVLLEKPVALSTLRETVVELLGLRNSVGPFTLTDYLQLAGMGRRSVRIELSRDGHPCGDVWVHLGEVWHARDLRGTGPGALSRLLDAEDVSVTALPSTDEPPRTLEGSCEALLLDHFRRKDEGVPAEEPEELVLDELPRTVPPPSRPAIPPRMVPPPPPQEAVRPLHLELPPRPPAARPVNFDELYDRGVEALLDRRYQEAFEAFDDASRLGSTPSLTANLNRLRTLGYGA